MIVAKIFAINKVAAEYYYDDEMLTQSRTQLSDFDRHTIYYSRKTLMIHFCLNPFFSLFPSRQRYEERTVFSYLGCV